MFEGVDEGDGEDRESDGESEEYSEDEFGDVSAVTEIPASF